MGVEIVNDQAGVLAGAASDDQSGRRAVKVKRAPFAVDVYFWVPRTVHRVLTSIATFLCAKVSI